MTDPDEPCDNDHRTLMLSYHVAAVCILGSAALMHIQMVFALLFWFLIFQGALCLITVYPPTHELSEKPMRTPFDWGACLGLSLMLFSAAIMIFILGAAVNVFLALPGSVQRGLDALHAATLALGISLAFMPWAFGQIGRVHPGDAPTRSGPTAT